MNEQSNFYYLKMSFIFQALFLSIIPHMLFYNNVQAQITGISNRPAGETSSKFSQSTLDSLVSPKSLIASVFGEVKNNNNTTKNTNPNSTQYAKNLVGDSPPFCFQIKSYLQRIISIFTIVCLIKSQWPSDSQTSMRYGF